MKLPYDDRPNTRTKDLVDLVLLIEHGLIEAAGLRERVRAVFAVRGTHELPDDLAQWQFRTGRFITGVYGEIIKPALTEEERRRLENVRFDFPTSAPGQEPLFF